MKVIFLVIFTSLSLSSIGQGKAKTIEFKKGEVFDLIFLRQKEGSEKAFKTYFDKAIPIVKKHGYNSGLGFSIKENPMQGNYHPQTMVVAKWNSLEDREKAMESLEKEKVDFHKLRREIWANFDMTYYELKNDLHFQVDPEMYNVVTAYWFRPNESGAEFVKDLYKTISARKGKLLVNLANGESPYGYHYDPDLLIISSWKNKKAFEMFKSDEDALSHYTISHINQFQIK